MPIDLLASGALVGTMPAPPQLFAGEAPIVTDSAPSLAAIQKWELCSLTPTGVKPFVDGTDDPRTAVISAVAAAAAGQQVPYYDAGKFNHEVIVWPAALDTLPKRKAAIHGSTLFVGHLV